MPDQWNLAFVKAAEALAFANLGPPAGWGVSVAHLDTGYSFHRAFGFADPATGLQPGALSGVIVADDGDFWHPSRGTAFDPLDPPDPIVKGWEVQDAGHGTFSGSMLAGVAAAEQQGVVPGLPLRSLRVTDGSLLLGDRPAAVAAAILHVAQPEDDPPLAPVINISLGRTGGYAPLKAAVDEAYRKGVIIVAAAGQVSHRVVYPARYERCIAAGGIERRPGNRFGVYAPYDDEADGYAYVDVWAPARGLLRANVASAVRPNPPAASYAYDYFPDADGTTYAAAHVSAAAALWLAFHGAALAQRYPLPWMRIEAFRTLLLTHNTVSAFPATVTQALAAHGNRARPLNMLKLLRAPLPAITQADKKN